MKKLILYLCLGLLLLFLLCFPAQAMESARRGLELCASTVIPSLFPFFVLSSLLIKTGFIVRLFRPILPLFSRLFGTSPSGTAAFFLGACAGYPMGAKSIMELYESNQITREDANHLLRFCNNAGPLFLLGTVGVGMFGNKKMGYLLLFAHLASAILLGILFRKQKGKIKCVQSTPLSPSWNLLSDVVNSAVQSILSICAYIILFQVVLRGLFEFGIISFFSSFFSAEQFSGMAKGILSGLFEMTSGTYLLSQLHTLSPRIILTAVSAVLGFGGFCVHAQTFGIIRGLNKKTYLTGKLLQGMFSAIITYLLYPFLFRDTAVFYTHIPTQKELNGELYLTLFLLIITLVFYMVLLLADAVRSKK